MLAGSQALVRRARGLRSGRARALRGRRLGRRCGRDLRVRRLCDGRCRRGRRRRRGGRCSHVCGRSRGRGRNRQQPMVHAGGRRRRCTGRRSARRLTNRRPTKPRHLAAKSAQLGAHLEGVPHEHREEHERHRRERQADEHAERVQGFESVVVAAGSGARHSIKGVHAPRLSTRRSPECVSHPTVHELTGAQTIGHKPGHRSHRPPQHVREPFALWRSSHTLGP